MLGVPKCHQKHVRELVVEILPKAENILAIAQEFGVDVITFHCNEDIKITIEKDDGEGVCPIL